MTGRMRKGSRGLAGEQEGRGVEGVKALKVGLMFSMT